MKFLKENSHIKGFIFDLDGTLLDSMGLWHEVDRKYLERYNIEYDESFSKKIIGMTFDESSIYFKDTFHIPKTCEEIKQDWNEMVEIEYRDHIPLKDGVLEFLTALKENNIKMCIATSCNKKHAQMALERLGINSYFDFILTSDEVGKNKEYPDIFEHCAIRMECKNKQCVVVEDLLKALQVAKKANFKTICMSDFHHKEHLDDIPLWADYYIDSFVELI